MYRYIRIRYFFTPRIRDEKFRDLGSGIKHPGSATLGTTFKKEL
jgi:hypothetical protein